MNKLLPIINVAVSAIALIVSVVVLLQVVGINGKLASTEEEVEETDPAAIPLSQLEQSDIEDQFVLTFKNADTGKTANVVVNMGFAIDTENEDAADTMTMLTSQGQIIRDKMQTILSSKDVTYFQDETKKEELKQEILENIRSLVGNDSIVDVYFSNLIVSEK